MASMLMKLVSVLALLHSATATRQLLQCSVAPQYIIAPSYVYPLCSITTPGCAWYSFANGADYVIINPDSGPGTTVNSDFVNLVNSIRSSDTYITSILGYVKTTYGAKSSADATAEIDKYNSFYKVDGIFLDEASIDCTTTAYYGGLVQHVRSSTLSPTQQDYTVLNWGTNGPECFFTAANSADNFVTFEHSYSSYLSYTPTSYMANYDPERFSHIVYNVTQANLASTMTKSKLTRAGRIYVTNDNLPNPYDTAPTPYTTFWQSEVNQAATTC